MSQRVLKSHAGQEGYGSEPDQREYLRKNGRQRNQLLKQFCKLEGPSGNSAAFQEGWDRIFGDKKESGT